MGLFSKAAASSAALEIILQARDDASSVIEKTKGSLGGLGGIAGGIATGGLALAAGAIIGLSSAAVGAGVAAFNMATDVQNATNTVATQLGISKEAASGFEGVMLDIFSNNFGENFEDIGLAVAEITRQMGNLPEDRIQQLAEDAFALRDAFGLEVNESISAANTLMRDFGLSGDEAMDFITAGLQRGLNASGDFLDSITEYATQFSSGGADAGQFFSVLETGLQNGVLGTDKAADMFKEFRVRIQDGSKTTADALAALGINTEEWMRALASGDMTAAEAFDHVTSLLRNVDDENLRMQAGVALLGTQFEDMGTQAALAVDLAAVKLSDLSGATDTLATQYENFGAMWEGIKRQVLVALKPLGDKLLEIGNEIMPLVSDFVDYTLGPAFEDFGDWLAGPGLDALDGLIAFVQDQAIPAISAFAGWIGENVVPVLQQAGDFLFNYVIPALDSFGQATDTGGGKLQEYWAIIAPVFEGIREIVLQVLGEVVPFIQEQFGFVVNWTRENWPLIQQTVETVMKFIDTVIITVLTAIAAFWAAHGEKISSIVMSMWTIIKTVVETTIKTVFDIIKLIMQLITGDWEGAWETIKRILSRIWEAIKTIVSETINIVKNDIQIVLSTIQGIWQSGWDAISAKLSEIWNGIVSAVREKIAEVRSTIQSKMDEIKDFLSGLNWKDLGRNLIDSLIEGIKDKADDLLDTLKDIIDSALDKAKKALGISSPSRVFMGFGHDMMRGLALGLEQAGGLPSLTLNAQLDRLSLLGQPVPAFAGGPQQINNSRRQELHLHVTTTSREEDILDDFSLLRARVG